MRRMLLCALIVCLLLPGATARAADTRTYYEIFPASFYDSDGDGMGDLNGIAEKVPYLQDLGVGGIWLMPIHPSPSYHKYDVMDYYSIDPSYGTMDDMEALLALLQENDMALLMDFVLNHTSSQHPWFLSAVESLPMEPCGASSCATTPVCRQHNPHVAYYHFTQDATLGWHTTASAPGWYYEGGFSPDMPDLDLENQDVLNEIQAIATFWLDKGVGGFRLDAAAHYIGESTEANVVFLAWFMETVRAVDPDVYVVGEVWKDAGTIAQYYQSGISSLFNFPFSGAEGAIVKAIRGGNGLAFAQKAEEWQATLMAFPSASDALFLSNHDNARIAGTLMQKPENLKMAASLYLTLPGTPFLYYGEEIGMTGSGRDENKRLPMVWDDANPQGQCLPPQNADQQAKVQAGVVQSMADSNSLWSHYKALLALRAEHPALRLGQMEAQDAGIKGICAYQLIEATEQLTVLHNLGNDEVALEWAGGALLQGFGNGSSLPTVQGSLLILPPMSSAVLHTNE